MLLLNDLLLVGWILRLNQELFLDLPKEIYSASPRLGGGRFRGLVRHKLRIEIHSRGQPEMWSMVNCLAIDPLSDSFQLPYCN